jgi:uncharacterized protein
LRKDYCDEPLSLNPSEYFLRQCFIATDIEEDLVADVVQRLGDDNIVISTDYPHADSRWPDAVDTFMRIDSLTDSARRKIFWDNCARLYNAD